MTNKELIKILMELPWDSDVYIENCGVSTSELSVESEELQTSHISSWEGHIHIGCNN